MICYVLYIFQTLRLYAVRKKICPNILIPNQFVRNEQRPMANGSVRRTASHTLRTASGYSFPGGKSADTWTILKNNICSRRIRLLYSISRVSRAWFRSVEKISMEHRRAAQSVTACYAQTGPETKFSICRWESRAVSSIRLTNFGR